MYTFCSFSLAKFAKTINFPVRITANLNCVLYYSEDNTPAPNTYILPAYASGKPKYSLTYRPFERAGLNPLPYYFDNLPCFKFACFSGFEIR